MNQANQAAHPFSAEEVMAFLDGELEPEQAAAVSAHLEECAACRETAAGFQQVSAHMASWTVEPAPARVTYQITSALKPKRLVSPWVWKGALTAVAMLMLVAISVPNLLRSRSAAVHPETALGPSQPWASQSDKVAGAETGPYTARGPGRVPQVQPRGPMIIRSASLLLVAKDFESARAAIERIAHQHQGYVAQLQASTQKDAGRSVSATLRVPAEQVDAALAELKRLGHVEQESQRGEEVTQQYVDLTARLSNARNTEQRLTAVLRQRTDKMTDVLAVEREIARVRGEIEQMDAERRTMEKRVAMATVEVQIREEFKAQVDPGPPSAARRLWNAGVEGYRNVSETIMGIAEFLLAYGPTLLLWLLILWFPARFAWRRLRALAA